MLKGTDLHSILEFYTNKNNSPYIIIDTFLDFLEKTAKKYSADYPAWNKWLENRDAKFWAEISVLAEEGKCELIPELDNNYIFMPVYYSDLINKVYRKADDVADLPFPSEESVNVTVPENLIVYLNSEQDFFSVMGANEKSANSLVKINFSDNFGSAIVPSGMFPRQLTETALLKVRNYLKRYGNKEYTYHKLTTPLQGKESFLKDQLEYIILRPIDAYNSIKDGRDLTYQFWAHFCALGRNDIKKKKDRLPMDIAAFQSFFIIDAVNRYFRALAVKQQEVELAFRCLENSMAKPPYLYSMGQILKFADTRGKLLLGQYTAEELEVWLKKQTTGSKDNELPSLLVIKTPLYDDTCFLLKDKMLVYCVRLLVEGRAIINDAILKQWSKTLQNYKKNPAMDDDEEFEKELYSIAKKMCPGLMALLADNKLLLVYHEAENTPNGVPPAARVFSKGVLRPYSSIFLIRRKDILQEAKYVLPFWYSLPIISSIIGFFKRLAEGRKKYKALTAKDDDSGEEILGESSRAGEIRAAALELEFFLIPAGHTLDSFLEELEDRWSRIIDRKARDDLIHDVQFLARDYLRHAVKGQKQFKPTQEAINQMAFNLVTNNAALRSLSARDSLLLYVELFLIKLLQNIK